MNARSKSYLAAIALMLPPVITPLLAEGPVETGKLSPKIRQAILVGLPQYDDRINRAPVEQPKPIELSQLPVDPELVVLPVFTIAEERGTKKINLSDTMLNTRSKGLGAGTGISEFTLKKYKISIPTILFIPIGFKFSW